MNMTGLTGVEGEAWSVGFTVLRLALGGGVLETITSRGISFVRIILELVKI